MLRLYLPYSSSPAAEEEGAAQVGTETRPSSGRHYYGWRGKDYVFVIGTVETVDAVRIPFSSRSGGHTCLPSH